jgi:UDP-N-acetylmuramoyl-L-alanyl-D-glutamate--2,6-diaminopimelate ligase
MNLTELIAAMSPRPRAAGALEVAISGLACDSRLVEPGFLFAAIRGDAADGHAFIPEALKKGAAAILAESDVPVDFRGTWIQVKDSRQALAEAAAVFHGQPSHRLLVAGVTGTNGKTTTAFILQHLIASARGGRCGLIGTVKYDLGAGKAIDASRTTPDSIQLQRMLAEMAANGCSGVSMEVSSHALDQHRAHGIEFDAAIFTNLTQDHLDYHKTMENYFAAKEKFFHHLAAQTVKRRAAAVINTDDDYGRRLAEKFRDRLNVVAFGMGVRSDFRATDVLSTSGGTTYTLQARGRSFLVRTPLIGRFNVANTLGALAAAYGMDLNLREAVANMAKAPQVPGRLQSVSSPLGFKVFVDYAHTPDALENVLKTLRDLSPARIITVFGCGGDRDARKRPLMAAAVSASSHFAILTSDNPRSENPEKILTDIEQGMRGCPWEKIADREEAIHRAVDLAQDGDIVLIAGKGHEAFQEFADRKVPFNDVGVASAALRRAGSSRP